MFEITEQSKKYIFIGLTVLLFLIFIIKSNKSKNKESPKKITVSKKISCCNNTINKDKLKQLYSFEEQQQEGEQEDNNELSDKVTIMNFNTEWCGYSKQFQPIWDNFTKKMSKKKINVKDVKCDRANNQGLCEKYDIEGFPTVKLVNNGKVHEFRGRRTVEDLSEFVNQHV